VTNKSVNKHYVTTLIILIISKDIYVVTIFRAIGIPRILLLALYHRKIGTKDRLKTR